MQVAEAALRGHSSERTTMSYLDDCFAAVARNIGRNVSVSSDKRFFHQG
jgi:hypothetical protein